jgi:hypothetical protein
MTESGQMVRRSSATSNSGRQGADLPRQKEAATMRPAMTDKEIALFDSLVSCSRRYVEFGAGGSTCHAAATAKDWIIAVDSSTEWLSKVASACNGVKAKLLHADIGKVGEWGIPLDEDRRRDWPSYHERLWLEPEANQGDFYFIDGRFRVACFIQAIMRAVRPDAIFAMHDFACRAHYHVILPFVREIATSEELTAFVRRPGFDRRAATAVLDQHRYLCA